MESADLAARARRAYEGGRLAWASRIAVYVLPLVALSALLAGDPVVSVSAGAALLAVATGARWRGRTWAAAVPVGLVAGVIPFGLMMFLKLGSAHFCALGGCMQHCIRLCAVGGLAAGLLLSARARRLDDGAAAAFLIVGGIVAGLTGMLGCFIGGVTGAAWMVLGELAATVPVLALQRRRR
jgi:hypothetical protein